MRVNFVLPGVAVGGGVRVVFEHANRLSDRGHEVRIIYPLVPPALEKNIWDLRTHGRQVLKGIYNTLSNESIEWFDLRVPQHRIPTLTPSSIELFVDDIPDADVTVATAWETAHAIQRLPRSKGRKAYFIQHYEIWDSWNSEQMWKQLKSKSVDTPTDPVEMADLEPNEERVRKQKSMVDESYTLPLAKITVSSWLETLLEKKFSERVLGTVPNSINHDQFYYDPSNGESGTSVLLPYRNKPWKGRTEISELVERIHQSYPNITIKAYSPRNIGDQLPPYVKFYQRPSDDELRRIYSDSDIFVFPSWVEGWGLPPFEAIACRSAVVSTPVGGVPEYFEDGDSISLVPPQNVDHLFEAVRELIEDDAERRRLQENGYEQVQNLTWENSTDEFEECLERVVEM